MKIDTHPISRLELLSMIAEAALACVDRWGGEKFIPPHKGPVKLFKSEDFQILYRTPKSMIFGAHSNYGIDIWTPDMKVFSIIWNSKLLKDFDLILMKRGPWIPSLLELAVSSNADYGQSRDELVIL